jgi:hypothetical protein
MRMIMLEATGRHTLALHEMHRFGLMCVCHALPVELVGPPAQSLLVTPAQSLLVTPAQSLLVTPVQLLVQ